MRTEEASCSSVSFRVSFVDDKFSGKYVEPDFSTRSFQHWIVRILSFLFFPIVLVLVFGPRSAFVATDAYKIHTRIVSLTEYLADFERLRDGLMDGATPSKDT